MSRARRSEPPCFTFLNYFFKAPMSSKDYSPAEVYRILNRYLNYEWEFITLTFRPLIQHLTQGLPNSFCKGPDGKNFIQPQLFNLSIRLASSQSVNEWACFCSNTLYLQNRSAVYWAGLPHIQTQSGRYIFKHQNEGRHQYPQPNRDWERKEMSEWVVEWKHLST